MVGATLAPVSCLLPSPVLWSPRLAELSSDWIGPHGGETVAAPAIGQRGMKPPLKLRYGRIEALLLLRGA